MVIKKAYSALNFFTVILVRALCPPLNTGAPPPLVKILSLLQKRRPMHWVKISYTVVIFQVNIFAGDLMT